MMKFVMEVASIPISEISEIADSFAAYLQRTHSIDISAMSYAEQVRYILGNYAGMQNSDMASFIPISVLSKPNNGKLAVIAAGAYLGEAVRMHQTDSQWKNDPENPIKAPYLEIECMENSTISYQPFDLMLQVFISGNTEKAIADSLPFENRKMLDEKIRKQRSKNVYSGEEKAVFISFMEQCLGHADRTFSILNSPDMLVDAFIIPPSGEYDAIRIVTCGMGGRMMLLPEGSKGKNPDRIELMIDLPSDWDLDGEFWKDETLLWPIRLLHDLADYPWRNGTWFRLGSAVSWPEPFAENIGFTGVLLTAPVIDYFGKCEVKISPGKSVQIYQAVPLYPEELNYRIEHGTRKLHELLGDKFSYIVNPRRENAVTGH